MGEFYAEAKALLLDRREAIIRLAHSLRRFNAVEFHRRSEEGGIARYSTSAALAIGFILVMVALLWADPIHDQKDIPQLFKAAIFSLFVMFLSLSPSYLVLRYRSKIPVFLFLLNVNLIVDTGGFVVVQTATYTATILNGQFYADLELIKHGEGRNSPIYTGLCQPLLDQRDALIDQYEINRLTGEYDLPSSRWALMEMPSDKEIMKRVIDNIQQTRPREAKLTGEEQRRLSELRSDYLLKLNRYTTESATFFHGYPIVIATAIFAPVFQFALVILTWAFIGKFYFSNLNGVVPKILATFRLTFAAFAGAAFTLLIVSGLNDSRPHLHYGLREGNDLLRGEYENHGWACGGHFDAKGLW